MLLLVPASASAGTVNGTNTFTGASVLNPGDWNDAANWSQGEVPDGLDDVVIPVGKVVTLASANGTAQTLSLAGSLTVDGGTIAGGRTLTLGAGTSTINGTMNVWKGAVLNLGATTNWSGGSFGLGGTGGGTVNIPASGVLNVTGDVYSSNFGNGFWNNQGTINRTTSTGAANINNALENDGAINVNSGTLSLQGGDGPGTSSGDYTAAAGSTLKFFGMTNDLTVPTASVGGAGAVELYGTTVVVGAGATFNPATLRIDGGTNLQLDTAGSTGNLTITGGTRSGSGTLAVNGPMTVLSSSVLTGTGTTTVAGTTTINATNFNVTNGHTFNLGPTTTWANGAIGVGGNGGAMINIGAGDVLNITGVVSSGAFGNGLWHNDGTINRTTSVLAAIFNNAVENDGTINANSGTLSLQAGDGPGTSSGDYAVAASATLGFNGGIHELTSTASVSGAGTVKFGSGTAMVAAGATFNPTTLNFEGGELQLDTSGSTGSISATQGVRSGSGTLTVSGAMDVPQVFTLKGNGTTTVGGTTTLNGTALDVHDGHTLNLGPTTNWSTGMVSVGGSSAATVNIGAGDVVNISGNVNSQGGPTGLWSNQGTINRTTSSGTVNFFTPVTSSGTINVDTGTLSFDSGLTQTAGLAAIDAGTTLGGAVALQGGTLKGTGTASGSVTNAGGTVAPGASPGKLSIGGNYTQSAGTLQAEIAGTGQGTTYDWLAVTGTVTINGGTLAVVADPAFDPAASDTFDLVTSDAMVTGAGFSAVTGATLSGKAYGVHTITGPPGKVRLAPLTAPPANSAEPSVPASAHPGDTISCATGTWTGSPTYSFQWLRDGSPISGATAAEYTVTAGDVGKSITCRVTATNSGGSTNAESSALVPTALPTPPSDPPSNPPSTPPSAPPALSPSSSASASSSTASPPPAKPAEQTVRGDVAFTQGSSNDLYLACTKLDLLLIDVLPAGARKVSVTGTADLRLAGQTAEILLDGKRVDTVAIGRDGNFAVKVPAPAKSRRKAARYQARVGTTVSQQLKLERRMVATTLTRSGSNLVLRGMITKPFARTPAAIQVERYLSCRQREKVTIARVLPDRSGRFAVTIPVPAGASAAIYRALTLVPPRPSASASAPTFTLPRAIDLERSF
jgi:fibronectin-binding autotransporter adhesin